MELLPRGVKLIGKIFKTSSDDIFSNWKKSILNSGVSFRMYGYRDLGRSLNDVGFIIVENKEILHGLLSGQLSLSLN